MVKQQHSYSQYNRISKGIILFFSWLILLSTAAAGAETLSAEQAFKLSSQTIDKENIALHFEIAPGYLLYKNHFQFKTSEGKAILPSEETWPTPEIKRDKVSGEIPVYKKKLTLKIPLPINRKEERSLLVSYQGCSDGGFCYAPLAQKVVFSKAGSATLTEIPIERFNESESDLEWVTTLLNTASFPMVIMAFFGVGLLLAFTPCVLPMVPILINILVGEDKPLTSDKRTLLLSSLYLFSSAVCYALVGALAGLMGSHLQTSFQKPLFLISFSFILVLFALNQLNILHIQMPHAISRLFDRVHFQHKQGTVISAIVMGGVSALMVSPCVTPALVGALTYIAQTGEVLLGASALFVLSLGMGTPLLIFVLIGGHFLPKAGSWMTYVKGATGLLLLALAASILMRAFPHHQDIPPSAINAHPSFIEIHNEAELQQALAAARSSLTPVVLDVYADWCVSCKKIDRDVFANDHVKQELQNAKLLRIDLSQSSDAQHQLQKQLGIMGPPTLIFFDHHGEEAKKYRLVGSIESDKFINHFQRFINEQSTNKR
jgi:thiol:disulfide interchange protein DsbD